MYPCVSNLITLFATFCFCFHSKVYLFKMTARFHDCMTIEPYLKTVVVCNLLGSPIKKRVLYAYVFFIRLLKWSFFFEISSFQVSFVYPWTSMPCFFALASSCSSVSPVIVWVQTGSPASLQFNDKVIL